VKGDAKILSMGTKCYRGPEFFKSNSTAELKVPFAADIYSAGIILFVMKSGGVYPHFENTKIQGVDLVDLMYNNNGNFGANTVNSKKKAFHFSAESLKNSSILW